jgi:heme/copper-type cytochrome/quinol oxidase subunit 3
MEASAPAVNHGEPEPLEWQPRAIWVGGRMLCGTITFFFASFLFAYFYLRALDVNHNWTIGSVHPSQGLGVAVMGLFVIGAVVYRLTVKRTELDLLSGAGMAVIFGLIAVVLQFVEYATLDFGAASGGYAAVFYGWTSAYAIVALFGIYWIETQIASMLRIRRDGPREIEIPAGEEEMIRAGVEASSFYWSYFVAIGFLAYVILYLVGA